MNRRNKLKGVFQYINWHVLNKKNMICPYCKGKINDDGFCPECGVYVGDSTKEEREVLLWEKTKSAISNSNIQYQEIIGIGQKQEKKKRRETVRHGIVIIAIVVCFFVILRFIETTKENRIKMVEENLVGKELSLCYSEYNFFDKDYTYYTLKFNEDGTVDYYYLFSGTKKDENQPLNYEGNYRYRLSCSIFGKFTIDANGNKFILDVDSGYVPTSIHIQD